MARPLSLLHSLAVGLFAPVVVPVWLVRLFRLRRELAAAEVVVASRHPFGFGNVVLVADIVRRLYAHKKPIYFTYLDPLKHNQRLGLIYADVRLIVAKRPAVAFTLFGRPVMLPPREVHDRLAGAMIAAWVRLFGHRRARVLSAFDVFDALPVPAELLPAIPKWPHDPGRPMIRHLPMFGLYHHMLERHPAPRLRLPARLRVALADRLRDLRGGRQAKLCGLYSRFDPDDDQKRNGAPIEDYVPALRLLVARGYQVLVHGDRPLDPSLAQGFGGMVADHDTVGVDRDLFRLFAGTESDIFVGDAGSGAWLAGINGTPRLLLNVWPIGVGVNHAHICFKAAADSAGRPFTAEELLGDCPRVRGTPDDIVEVTMGAAEIEEAVAAFLFEPPRPRQPDPFPGLSALLPPWTPYRLAAGAILSPAWVARHAPEHAAELPRAVGGAAS